MAACHQFPSAESHAFCQQLMEISELQIGKPDDLPATDLVVFCSNLEHRQQQQQQQRYHLCHVAKRHQKRQPASGGLVVDFLSLDDDDYLRRYTAGCCYRARSGCYENGRSLLPSTGSSSTAALLDRLEVLAAAGDRAQMRALHTMQSQKQEVVSASEMPPHLSADIAEGARVPVIFERFNEFRYGYAKSAARKVAAAGSELSSRCQLSDSSDGGGPLPLSVSAPEPKPPPLSIPVFGTGLLRGGGGGETRYHQRRERHHPPPQLLPVVRQVSGQSAQSRPLGASSPGQPPQHPQKAASEPQSQRGKQRPPHLQQQKPQQQHRGISSAPSMADLPPVA